VLGAVLAGGAGRRLGGGKALAPLGGRPLIAWPLDALRATGVEAVVVAKPDTELPPLGVDVVRETETLRHPLAGVVAALDHAGGRRVLVVGADMPFVTPDVLRLLATVAADAEVVVARAGGRLHPLCARYGPGVRGELAAALAAQAPMRATVAALAATELDVAEDLLFNVNSPADLAAAEARLGPTPPPPASRSEPRTSGDP
jgi:molybdopterin-guanine dinucleotide biosynthesis protein A